MPQMLQLSWHIVALIFHPGVTSLVLMHPLRKNSSRSIERRISGCASRVSDPSPGYPVAALSPVHKSTRANPRGCWMKPCNPPMWPLPFGMRRRAVVEKWENPAAIPKLPPAFPFAALPPERFSKSRQSPKWLIHNALEMRSTYQPRTVTTALIFIPFIQLLRSLPKARAPRCASRRCSRSHIAGPLSHSENRSPQAAPEP